MSTSLRYHAFGLRGSDSVKTEYTGGRVVFTIRQRPHTCRCSVCGSRRGFPRGHQERTFHAVPIGGKPVGVVLPIPRVPCPTWGVIRQVSLTFADPRRSSTRAFER
jgi:transposase